MTTDEKLSALMRQVDRIEYEVQQISKAMLLLLEEVPEQDETPTMDLDGQAQWADRDQSQPL